MAASNNILTLDDLADAVDALRKMAQSGEPDEGLRPFHPMAEAHFDTAVAALATAVAQFRLANYHRMRGQ